MITVKGQANMDRFIIGHIIDPSVPNIEFKNITFDCKTIKDASGHIFVQQNTDKWIPVSEKPKENGKYIASLEDSVYPEASFFNGKWFMRSFNGIAREFGEYEVIAWMPLPEPYREEYELAMEQMEHDVLYEPTYNPEDGSM